MFKPYYYTSAYNLQYHVQTDSQIYNCYRIVTVFIFWFVSKKYHRYVGGDRGELEGSPDRAGLEVRRTDLEQR